jgi:hypothetical protein
VPANEAAAASPCHGHRQAHKNFLRSVTRRHVWRLNIGDLAWPVWIFEEDREEVSMVGDEPEDFETEYLTIAQLSRRIHYTPQTIRNLMSQGVFRLGVHYVKPRRRVLFKWSTIEQWLHRESGTTDIPLTRNF